MLKTAKRYEYSPVSALGLELTSAEAALKESIIWISCRHENIVPFFGLSNHYPSRITLVSQWMAHGTVSSFLKKNPRWHRGQLVRVYFISKNILSRQL
jgi:serine/threonine protein kinase